jgi:hypothetical protein
MESQLQKQPSLRRSISDKKLSEKSTHEYYSLALGLENKLVKVNFILTIISIICMLFEIGYGLAVWNIK